MRTLGRFSEGKHLTHSALDRQCVSTMEFHELAHVPENRASYVRSSLSPSSLWTVMVGASLFLLRSGNKLFFKILLYRNWEISRFLCKDCANSLQEGPQFPQHFLL